MEKKYVYVGSMAYFANHMKAKLMAKGTKASQRTCFHQHFFRAEFHTNVEIKMKMEYFVTYSSFLGGNLPKNILLKFFHHIPLGLGVGVGGSFLLDFYFLGQVLETCCHLMLNHSWDVQHEKFEEKFGFHMFAHCCGYNKSIENLLFM
jgi:hypothetical protein